MSAGGGVVLCYHAVADHPHRLALPRDQLLAHVRSALLLRRSVHVTFDDAYANVRGVVPELLALGANVTVFACTGFADRGGAPLTVEELATDDPDELELLATMTWNDLRGLTAAGVAIGSHGVTHAHLTMLSDDELERELVVSRQRLETELGRPCRLLAYPYGEHDARVRAAARAAGYERAFALRSRGGDAFALPRVDLYRRDRGVRALLKLSPLYAPLSRLVSRRARLAAWA